MDVVGYLIFGCMLFGVLLAFRSMYLGVRLFRYVYNQYPEEGSVIRSYMWHRYHGLTIRRMLKTLIKKHGTNDPELALRAKKATRSYIHFFVWFLLVLIGFAVALIYHLLTKAK